MSRIKYSVIGPNGPISHHYKTEAAVKKFWQSDALRIIVTGFGGLYKGRLIPHGPDTVAATFISRDEEGGAA